MRLRLLVLALALVAPAFAQGQAPTVSQLGTILSAGSRVRVSSSVIGGRPKGTVATIDSTTVTLIADGNTVVRIPLTSITSLDGSTGRRRYTLRGLVWGAAFGVVTGAFNPVDPSNCGHMADAFCSRSEAVTGGLMGGALLGAGIGWLIHTDRWAPITLSTTAHPGAMQPQEVRISVSVPGFRTP